MDLAGIPRKRKRSIVDKTPSRRSSIAADDAKQNESEIAAVLIKLRCLTITKFMLERSSEVTISRTVTMSLGHVNTWKKANEELFYR